MLIFYIVLTLVTRLLPLILARVEDPPAQVLDNPKVYKEANGGSRIFRVGLQMIGNS